MGLIFVPRGTKIESEPGLYLTYITSPFIRENMEENRSLSATPPTPPHDVSATLKVAKCIQSEIFSRWLIFRRFPQAIKTQTDWNTFRFNHLAALHRGSLKKEAAPC